MIPYVLIVVAGALLCNSIPHLASGLRGEPFPTPFATPPGVGLSSPLVNVLWGWANLVIAVGVMLRQSALVDPVPGFIAAALGFVGIGIYLARHFGKVRRDRDGAGSDR